MHVSVLRRRVPFHPPGEGNRSGVLQRPAVLHVVGEGPLRLYHGRRTESVLACEETSYRRHQTGVTGAGRHLLSRTKPQTVLTFAC